MINNNEQINQNEISNIDNKEESESESELPDCLLDLLNNNEADVSNQGSQSQNNTQI